MNSLLTQKTIKTSLAVDQRHFGNTRSVALTPRFSGVFGPAVQKNCFSGFFSNPCAFTLIEMMVVIAIIATVLMAAMPSLYGFVHKEGFRKTVSDVLDTCRSARAEAIMHDTTAQLVFHPREGTCEASAGGSGHGVWAHTARFENCTIEMLDVNLREFKDEPEAIVHFYPNGRCDEMTLVLRSDKNEWRKIAIECTTGIPTVSSRIQ